MSIPADDSQAKVNAIETMAQHKGACEALLQACRLLRAHQMGGAADLIIANVEKLADTTAAASRAMQ